MDNFTYNYLNIGSAPSNRLGHVGDAVTASANTDDIESQSANNYSYDELGQLIGDQQELIASIEWRSGDKKIKTLNRTANAGNKPDLEFVYNPMGQRILKIEKPRVNNVLKTRDWWKYTYYTYDANGQVMATYDVSLNSGFKYAYLKDQNIYGASRLGMRRKSIALYENTTVPYIIPDVKQNTLGDVAYEITNYLGNVNVVISDRKLWVPTTGAFKACTLSRTDYFPFGMEISSRTTNSNNYRFGYQGSEKDNEVSGNGNSYTAEFWQYDSRLGRRWNIDPVVKYHESPYACFANNPISFIDPSGADTIKFNNFTTITDRKCNGNDGNTGVQLGPLIRNSSSIEINVADGPDVFYYNTTIKHYDVNGNLKISTKSIQFDPVGGGHNKVGGSISYAYFFSYTLSDREALGCLAPPELMEYLIEKSDGWTRLKYREAESMKSTISLFQTLNTITEFAYSFYIGDVLFKGLTGNLGSLSNGGITSSGINKIERHLATMDEDIANDVMISRLRQINAGKINATFQDVNFYNHELRELQYMKNGMKYNDAHQKALKDFNIPYKKGFEKSLYTEDALKAGDEGFRKKY